MGKAITEIEDIEDAYAAALKRAGITNTDHLLEKCAAPKGRADIAARVGVDEAVVLKWTNMADLMRINGIGPSYAQLLEAAGVDTVKELSRREAKTLRAVLKAENDDRKVSLVGRVVGVATVQGWIDAAKTMRSEVTY